MKLITSSGGFGDLIKIKSSEQITLSGFTVGVEKSAGDKKRNIVIEDSNEITLSGLYLYNYATEGASIEHIPLTISNASNCKIKGCTFTTGDGSAYGLIIGAKSKGNIIENNTFNTDRNSIFMENTTNNILCNNTIHEIWVGGEDIYSWPVVEYYYSDNNTIHNNEIYSISMQGSNNTIYNNIISLLGDKNDPTLPFAGDNNTIYLNNIFGVGRARVLGNNIWNSSVPINYTYNGSEYTNYTGNFWHDYTGVDNNSDGIGDVPYKVCDDNYDYYPLIEPSGLTFDIGVTAITRPYIIYADRENNTILVTIERNGTYLTPEDVCVNFMVNDSEVDSKMVKIAPGENVVNFKWRPPNAGDYKLGIEVHPKNAALKEMSDTNNEFSIDGVKVSPLLFSYTDNISSALEFLNGEQLETGNIWSFENSGWAALAIIAAGEDPSAGRYSSSLIEYLREEPRNLASFSPRGATPPCLNMPEDFARMVMVISAIGEDPTNFGDVNYLVMLKSCYDGEQFGDSDTVKDDALAILALVSCGDNEEQRRTKEMITNASKYIKGKQNEDGGWSSFNESSDVRTTSLVIQALISTGEDKESETIERALDYLRKAKRDDGGYYDVISTSYAIQAFIAAGEDLSNDSKTIDYLLSLQLPDGSFNYTANISLFPPRMTAFPVPPLCGEPYPVMMKTISKSYELPDVSISDLVTWAEIRVNTSYTVKANIRSNGGIYYADLLSDAELVERKRVHSVWHDSLTSVSFTWKSNNTGCPNLTIFADSMNNITESDEDNNNITKRIEVVYPDLYPSGITSPDKIYANVTNVIKCTINGTTDEHFNLTLDADGEGELIGKRRVEGIRDNVTLYFKWRPPAAGSNNYNLRLRVDSDEDVHEQNEANNMLSKSVDVLLPDLIPTLIAADKIFVNARNKVNVTVKGFAEGFNVSLIENGTVVGERTNVTCYGTGNITVYGKPTTPGNHTITAFVDSGNDMEETNEENNNITRTFEVLLPDLVPIEITPEVLYIDEVNTIGVVVNGTAEGFNATLVADEVIDRSGPLCFLISPIFNGTSGEAETFYGTHDISNLTYNITEQRANWSWEDINMLDVIIASNSSTGLMDSGDTWNIDYVAVVVNYTDANSTNRTVELNASEVISGGNWSNANSAYISDDEYATATGIGYMRLGITDTDAQGIYGNITSVVIKVEQRVVNAVTSKKDTTRKKTKLDTYNGSIEFEWVPMKLGDYRLTVFLDSDNDTAETNETNNNLTRSVIVANRIELELTSPLGGEVWSGIQNITWNASYEEPLLIDLFYSPDRGYRWIDIATNETNDGLYAWNTGEEEAPADPIDGEYMMKIVARSGMVTAEDKSDICYIRNKNAGFEWGSFHDNAGYAPCDGPGSPEIAWMSEDIGASSSSSLIVAGGKVFVYATGEHGIMTSSSYTYLVALKESNAEVLWATRIAPQELGSWATPAYKDGSVFVSSGEGVYRIDAETGKIGWEFRFPTGEGSVNGGPAVTDRAIYAGDWDGWHYYCIKNNRTEPRELWNFYLGDGARAQSTPAIAYGNVYFGSFCGGECQSKAFCVDAVNGTEIWSTPTGDVCGSVTVADGLMYFTTYAGDDFYALNAINGSLIWKKHEGWSDSTPAYYSPPKSTSTRSYIYVVIVHGFIEPAELHCFDAKTGDEIWRTGGNVGYWTASPIVTRDGKVFVGNSSTLSCLDAFTGDVIWQSDGGPSPVVVNGFVYNVHGGRVIAYGNNTLPDLIVVNANASDDEYVVGKEGNIIAMIENVGRSNVTESFKVELRKKGEVIDEKTVEPPLNIRQPIKVTFKLTPEEVGDIHLTVEVDPPPGNVSESNPFNNTANVTVLVEDNKPDIKTSIINVSPKPAYISNKVMVKANITNIGNDTNKSFYGRFYVDDYQNDETLPLPVPVKNNTLPLNFSWIASSIGNHTLIVEAMVENDSNYTNNRDSKEIEVMPTPTPSPTSTPKTIGFGPGSGGGLGGGTGGGIGEGRGTGEAGAGESGGMQIPVNASSSAAEETKKEVPGYLFGNTSSGASGGGGTLPVVQVLLAILIIALFYLGYYKERRAHRRSRK
ncbi:MAG: CARDB domain-containing protein [Halobacteriota archaeon]